MCWSSGYLNNCFHFSIGLWLITLGCILATVLEETATLSHLSFPTLLPKGEFRKIRILHPEHPKHTRCLRTTAVFSGQITIYVEAYPMLSSTFLSTPCCLCCSVGTTLFALLLFSLSSELLWSPSPHTHTFLALFSHVFSQHAIGHILTAIVFWNVPAHWKNAGR